MSNNGYNFGFKPIDEFSFDECFARIEQNRVDNVESDEQLLERYTILLSQLQQKDDALFRKANDKSALEKYIISHPLDNTAKKYKLRHIVEAKKKIDKIKEDSKKNKKKAIMIMLSTIAILAFLICWINYNPVKYLNVDESLSFTKYGDSIRVTAQTNVPSHLIKMEVESGSDWLHVSGADGSYTLVAKPNPVGARYATIKISAPNRLFGSNISWDSKIINISQESGIPTYINFERNSISFDKFGKPSDKSQLIINTDGVLDSIASTPDWCNVSLTPIDKGRYECVVTMDKNDGDRKIGQISFNGGNITQSISVQQESGLASYIGFNNGSIFVSPREETKYVDIMTDGTSWTIYSIPSWIVASDNGNNSMKLKIEENENDRRNGTLIVKSNNGHTASLTINQGTSKASYIRAGQTSISAGISGLDKYISVSTDGKDWSVYSTPSWLSVTPDYDGMKIYVEIPSNSGKINQGEIILASNNGQHATIYVKQDGEPTDFGTSKSTVYFSKEEDYESVTIHNNSKMSVSASADKDWIDYYISGNRITISCTSNKRSGKRSGIITLRCGSQTKKITVKQNGYIPCWNQSCQGGRVYGPYGWVGPCMVCGGSGGQESRW